LDRMLIVTFTRAAAADMRIKLSEKLSELKRASENKNAKVYASICDATDAMSVCDIGTLHGYCQKLIRRYYGAAGIDPAATLCEDGEISLIERDAVETAVADRLKSGDKYFAAVYDMLSTRRSAENVVSTVTDIVEFALSNAEPDKYLVESA
ncbi:MAG: UvrD-helicase domain-containing protein, partial [Clostridia bacterium]|nr:UvrD-helicase domain-containing protein [Clostridia bacterium]